MPSASPPGMKLFRTLAGLGVFALAAIPAVAQHGGGSSHGGGGGGHFSAGGASHAGGSGGGESRSYSGGSSAHYSGGNTFSAGRSVGTSGGRGSSESYTFPGTGTHYGGSSEFTNHGGIRFSDFGVEETPRFTASMIPSKPAAANSRDTFQVADSNVRSEHDGRGRMDRGHFDRGEFGFRRFPHSGYLFFGAFGTPFCDPFGWAAYDQTFVANNAIGCFGDGYAGLTYGADDDQLADQEYPTGDEAAADAPDDPAATDASADASTDAKPQVTLLQLKDGSMYGLTSYWVEGGELHYVTNYGGANAIPLDRIDLAKTVQLNASSGQAFILEEKPASSKVAR
jgi:hypothetical protein